MGFNIEYIILLSLLLWLCAVISIWLVFLSFRFFHSLNLFLCVVCCHRFYYSPFAIITIMRNWNSMYKTRVLLWHCREAEAEAESLFFRCLVWCGVLSKACSRAHLHLFRLYSYTYILYLYYHYNSISQPISRCALTHSFFCFQSLIALFRFRSYLPSSGSRMPSHTMLIFGLASSPFHYFQPHNIIAYFHSMPFLHPRKNLIHYYILLPMLYCFFSLLTSIVCCVCICSPSRNPAPSILIHIF